MSFAAWMLLFGALLLGMVLLGTLLGRMQLTSAMIYLGIGWVLGPGVLDIFRPDPFSRSELLLRSAELGLAISLFAVGLRLGVPFFDRLWRLPLRLAFLSLAVMVGLTAIVGVVLLQMPLGAAILLGAILAPTDPVLASSVHTDAGKDPERVGFSLAAEGALNDAAALPFVILGLAVLRATGDRAIWHFDWLQWTAVDLIWTPVAGVAIGGSFGALMGWAWCFCGAGIGRPLAWTPSSDWGSSASLTARHCMCQPPAFLPFWLRASRSEGALSSRADGNKPSAGMPTSRDIPMRPLRRTLITRARQ